ncbi:MAG: hypothetical protein ACM3PS_14445 [Syntrophothermus sp.]
MPVLILIVVVIIVGVAIALRSTPSKGQDAFLGIERASPTLGLWCLVCGLIAAVSVVMVGQATYGWVSGFDPPGWLRILAFWMFPVSVIASVILGALSLKRHSRRILGATGLALDLLSVGAFFAMLASVE